jgi:hypothetical protein
MVGVIALTDCLLSKWYAVLFCVCVFVFVLFVFLLVLTLQLAFGPMGKHVDK